MGLLKMLRIHICQFLPSSCKQEIDTMIATHCECLTCPFCVLTSLLPAQSVAGGLILLPIRYWWSADACVSNPLDPC